MISLFLIATTATGWATVGAEDPPHAVELRPALRALGAEFIAGSGTRIRRANGREDYALTSRIRLEALLAAVKRGYRSQRDLSGFRVAGYARLNRRSSWSVTLRKGQLNRVVEIRQHALGTQVEFWSTAIDRGFRRRGPLRPLPPPHMPRIRPSSR